MTWDDGLADDRAHLLASSSSSCSARRASRTARSTEAPRGRRRARCRRARGGLPPPRRHAAGSARGMPNLCLAGGVALNAVANGRIRPETPFEELYVQPAAGDSGTAVGAAYYVWNQVLGQPRGFVMEHAYTGPEYSRRRDARLRSRAAGVDARAARRRRALPHRRRADRRRRRRRLVPGPDGVRPARARAPLDRRRPAPRRHEGRPQRADQAPRAVPAVRAVDPRRARPASGSSRTTRRRSWCSSTRRAPTSASGSRRSTTSTTPGRVQTVERARRAALLPADRASSSELTGVPILLNTSFNENEPIVMTPTDAIDTFAKTKMDVLVLGNYVFRRNGRT